MSGVRVALMTAAAVRVAIAVLCLALFAPRWASAQASEPADKSASEEKAPAKKKAKKARKAAKKKAAKAEDAAKAEEPAKAEEAGQAEPRAKKGSKGKKGKKAASSPDTDTDTDAAEPSPAPAPAMPSKDPTGEQENPRAPVTEFDKPKVEVQTVSPPVTREAYPIERALRPITLPYRMTEVTIDAPNTFNPYVQSGLLGVHHGITRQIQAGLRYGTGTLFDGEFFAGKTFAIDGEYQVFPWLAAQLSVPMMVDPYSVGVTIGAPMTFTFIDRLRIDLLRDLVTFKLSRFAPSVTDAAFDDRQVELEKTNSQIDDGEFNVDAAASWQLQPNMSIEGRFGIKARDFKFRSDQPTAFDVGLIYSSTSKIDIGGRLGFADLNKSDESFGLWLLAALRI